MAYNNSSNINVTGIVTLSSAGAATGSTLTNHGVLVGGASNAITSLSVGATGTVLAGSTGANPAFTATPSVTSITFGSGSALNAYVVSTVWTPALTFGGASVDLTYATQSGTSSRIGSIVVFRLTIVLSSKGSSVGNMSISGLPLNPASATAVSVRCGAAITSATASMVQTIINTDASINMESVILSTGAVAILTDTNFANNTEIEIEGSYLL